MTLPVLPGVRPPSIGDSANGQIPADLLVNARTVEDYDVFLAPEAVTLYNQLRSACYNATHVTLAILPGGAYRTLTQQQILFFQRYEYPAKPNLPADHYRTYQGRRYSLRPGMAAAATPGTSNHGLAGTIDVCWVDDDGTTLPINASNAWSWLLDEGNAIRYGWSWELQSEAWHLRMIRLPKQPPIDDEDEMTTLFRVNTEPEAIYALSGSGVRHIGGNEGAIRMADDPHWADNVETWTETPNGGFGEGKVPADVHAWLKTL